MISASDIKIYYSGGEDNTDPALSLGGAHSDTLVPDELENVFPSLSNFDIQTNIYEYRCVYVFNESLSDSIYNLEIFFEQFNNPTQLSIGVNTTNETQVIYLNQAPLSGSFQIRYTDVFGTAYDTQSIIWNNDSIILAERVRSAIIKLPPIIGDVSVSAIISTTETNIIVTFGYADGNKIHNLMQIVNSFMTPYFTAFTVYKDKSGSPINTEATTISNAERKPADVFFYGPTESVTIGTLKPGEGFPFWVKRSIPAFAQPATLGGAKFRMRMLIAQFTETPKPSNDASPTPTPSPTISPTPTPTGTPCATIGAGYLYMQGENKFGRLGNNSVTNTNVFVKTLGDNVSWSDISLGSNYVTAGVKQDGTLWLWGENSLGQLGDDTVLHRSSPVQTITKGTSWSKVYVGGSNTAAIKTDGSLWLWGAGTTGAIGDNTVLSRSSPVQTIAGGTNWRDVAVGSYHTVAIKTDNTLWTWGWNTNGQLGDGTKDHRSSPVQIIANSTDWEQVDCKWRQNAAIKKDGSLWTWGLNSYGQLGDNSTQDRSSPVQTADLSYNWQQVKCGNDFIVGLKKDGTLWGSGFSTYKVSSPVQIAGGLNGWVALAASTNIAAIRYDNNLYSMYANNQPVLQYNCGSAWNKVSAGGWVAYGVLSYLAPTPTPTQSPTPTPTSTTTPTPSGTDPTSTPTPSPSPTPTGTPTPTPSGTDPTPTSTPTPTPTPTGDSPTGFKSFVWGQNDGFSSGYINVFRSGSPVMTQSSYSWKQIIPVDQLTIALRKNNIIYYWGTNSIGILVSEPQILASGSWKKIALTGNDKLFAIKNDDTLWEIDIITKNSTLYDNQSWKDIQGRWGLVAGIKSDDTLWFFGQNLYGEFGNNKNSSDYQSSPVQTVYTGSTWSSVSLSVWSVAAIKTDGTLWTWGRRVGLLVTNGSNISIDKSTPTQVYGGGSDWYKVSIGQTQLLALKNDGSLYGAGENYNSKLYSTGVCQTPITLTHFTWDGVPSTWTDIWCDEYQYARSTDGHIYVWGDTLYIYGPQYETGTFGKFYNNKPIKLSAPDSYDWKDLSISGNLVFGLADIYPTPTPSATSADPTPTPTATPTVEYPWGSKLFLWGTSLNQTAGRNLPIIYASSPIQTLIGGDDWKSLHLLRDMSFGIKTDGALWVWGTYNYLENFGNQPTVRSTPYELLRGPFESISEGGILTQDKKLISLDSRTTALSPIQICTDKSWQKVCLSAGLDINGKIWTGTIFNLNYYEGNFKCKGYNDADSYLATISPVMLSSESNWVDISSNEGSLWAIRTDGTLWRWGAYPSNTYLWLGTTKSPVQVYGGGSDWKKVSVGYDYHILALKNDGSIWAWGKNDEGQLGDNTREFRPSPVQITPNGEIWADVQANRYFSLAIKNDGKLYSWGFNKDSDTISGGGMLGNNTSIVRVNSPVQVLSSSNLVWKKLNSSSAKARAGGIASLPSPTPTPTGPTPSPTPTNSPTPTPPPTANTLYVLYVAWEE